jgi:transcriptional regulator GlxA family with amidase domain
MADPLAWLSDEMQTFKESDKRREKLVLVSFGCFLISTSSLLDGPPCLPQWQKFHNFVAILRGTIVSKA